MDIRSSVFSSFSFLRALAVGSVVVLTSSPFSAVVWDFLLVISMYFFLSSLIWSNRPLLAAEVAPILSSTAFLDVRSVLAIVLCSFVRFLISVFSLWSLSSSSRFSLLLNRLNLRFYRSAIRALSLVSSFCFWGISRSACAISAVLKTAFRSYCCACDSIFACWFWIAIWSPNSSSIC